MEYQLPRIVFKNNQGCALLTAGELGQAQASFQSALEVLLELEQARSPNAGKVVLSSSNVKFHPSSSIASLRTTPILCDLSALSQACENVGCGSVASSSETSSIATASCKTVDEEHFLYRRALTFDISLIQNGMCISQWLTIASAMIYFNLALTCQLSLKDQLNKERFLDLALQLYDICLDQIQDAVQTMMPHYLHVVVAALNNMAIAYFDLCNFSRVKQIVTSLQKLGPTIQGHSQCNSQGPVPELKQFQETDMEGLLLNLIVLNANTLAPVA